MSIINQTPIIPLDPTPRGFITAVKGLAWIQPNLNTGNLSLDYCNVESYPQAPGDLGYPNPILFHSGVAGSQGPNLSLLGDWTSGGTPDSYSITPSLPTGLSFNTSTGVISGTSTVISYVAYTITATNTSGSSSQSIMIGVVA